MGKELEKSFQIDNFFFLKVKKRYFEVIGYDVTIEI